MKVLVTGSGGFVGHHLVDALLRAGHSVVGLDRLDFSGNLNRLAEMVRKGDAFRQTHHDLRAEINPLLARQIGPVDWVLHLAAASHVDRSISDPLSFVMDNVVGACNALTFARDAGAKFLYFSTDEVFGPAHEDTAYQEWERYRSGNPYAATKAGGEELAIAFENTYKMHVIVTHTMNVFGPRQHPEKFIPSTIQKVLAGEIVTIHADKTMAKAGSRFYIHAADVARAVLFLMEKGRSGQKYNIVGEREVDNLELAQTIASAVGKPLRHQMMDFHSSRPGHDLRYALDGGKLRAMGFVMAGNFERRLAETVNWTLANRQWLPDMPRVMAAAE